MNELLKLMSRGRPETMRLTSAAHANGGVHPSVVGRKPATFGGKSPGRRATEEQLELMDRRRAEDPPVTWVAIAKEVGMSSRWCRNHYAAWKEAGS